MGEYEKIIKEILESMTFKNFIDYLGMHQKFLNKKRAVGLKHEEREKYHHEEDYLKRLYSAYHGIKNHYHGIKNHYYDDDDLSFI